MGGGTGFMQSTSMLQIVQVSWAGIAEWEGAQMRSRLDAGRGRVGGTLVGGLKVGISLDKDSFSL